MADKKEEIAASAPPSYNDALKQPGKEGGGWSAPYPPPSEPGMYQPPYPTQGGIPPYPTQPGVPAYPPNVRFIFCQQCCIF